MFLIIGKYHQSTIDYLELHSFPYYMLKDTAHYNDADKHSRLVDFRDDKTVFKAVDSLRSTPTGVLTIYEQYIPITAKINQHLGLPGLSPEAAEVCTDKFLMRQKLQMTPQKISPDFALVNNETNLRAFAASHSFPLILKPANLSKSLLVTKNNSLAELLANYQKTIAQISDIYKKYAPSRRPRLLIEEFLEGSVHSVDAFTGADGEPQVLEQVVDYQTGYDIGFDDNFHYSRVLPSRLSAGDQAVLRTAASMGIKALGIKNTPSHVEVIMTKQGPRIVEIGARNGGYRDRMHKLANGLDIIGNALRLASGQPLMLTPTKNEPCAVLELFPRQKGIFTEIKSEEILRNLPSLTYLSVKAKRGEIIGKSSDGYKMTAVIILHNHDTAQFNHDLDYINNHVSVMTSLN